MDQIPASTSIGAGVSSLTARAPTSPKDLTFVLEFVASFPAVSDECPLEVVGIDLGKDLVDSVVLGG